MTDRVQSVAISKIQLDPNQPRQTKNKESIAALATNMTQHGLINPIEIDEAGMVVTGESRYLAAKQLGWPTIQARVIKRDGQTYVRQLSENLVRNDMKPLDIAMTMQRMRDEGMTSVDIGKHFGLGRTTVQHYLALLKLDDPRIKALLTKGVAHKIISMLNEIHDDVVKEQMIKLVTEDRVRGWNAFVAVRRYLYATHDLASATEALDSVKKVGEKRKHGTGTSDLSIVRHFESITPSVAKQMKKNLVPGQRLIGAMSALAVALEQCKIEDVIPLHYPRLLTTYQVLTNKIDSLKTLSTGHEEARALTEAKQ
jgi:ParB/RepB/Spo0J family partition protein